MDQLGLFDLDLHRVEPDPAAEPEPDVEEEQEWEPDVEAEVAAAAATGCPRCGEETGHLQTCPNLIQSARFVDINVMLERQAADQAGEEEGPVEGQETMFGADDDFKVQWQEWRGMPEYVSRNLAPFKSLLVHFEKEEDYKAFGELVNQKWLTRKTRSIWYPEAEWARERGVARYADVSEHDEQGEGLTA